MRERRAAAAAGFAGAAVARKWLAVAETGGDGAPPAHKQPPASAARTVTESSLKQKKIR